MALRFAFLTLEEHPYGREMLRVLLEQGFCPSLVVQEASPLADEERLKFLTRIDGQPVPPTIAALIAGRSITCRAVDNHNGAACREMLQALAPDLLVLGGTRILRPTILAIPGRGTLNAHPGLLPRLRGSSSVAWALYKDLPIGSTVHLVDASIDTGPIVLRRRLPVRRSDSYEQIVRRVLTLSAELMAEALALLHSGQGHMHPQDPAAGETLRVIPPNLLAEAKARLAAGQYHHVEETDGNTDL
jgi:methionyl-tRNA formyltransferase